jgi:hypothetical protein
MDDRQSVSANAPSISEASEVNFEFDDLLVNSRVYRQVLASAGAEVSEPGGKVEGSSGDFPDSQTIISAQTKNVTQDLESWDISKHEQEPDTVSASTTPRLPIENNDLGGHEGQGNFKLDEAQISRKPIARPGVVQANSPNCYDSFDNELSGTNGPNTNKPHGKRPRYQVLVPQASYGWENIHHCARCDVKLHHNIAKNQAFAVKLIKHDLSNWHHQRCFNPEFASAHGEIAILCKLNHLNIIRLIKVFKYPAAIGLVFRYFPRMDLSSHIINHSYVREASAKRFFAQIISGVEYLHKMGIIHRNLHPKNLLLDDNFNIIISGFSQAYIIDPAIDADKKTNSDYNPGFRRSVEGVALLLLYCGEKQRTGINTNICQSFTPVYTAPEMEFHGLLSIPSQTDVWSCGVILVSVNVRPFEIRAAFSPKHN